VDAVVPRYAAQVITTSSGDAALTTSDQWAVFDDLNAQDVALSDGQQPATATCSRRWARSRPSTPSTTRSARAARHARELGGVTVPPGGKVVLMHFAVQQVSGGAQARGRLVQLPPGRSSRSRVRSSRS
jgi:hypothetical protein